MIKSLQSIGNSKALVLDKAIMEAVGLRDDSLLQITIVGGALIITPADVNISSDEIAASALKIRKRYKKTLDNLAK